MHCIKYFGSTFPMYATVKMITVYFHCRGHQKKTSVTSMETTVFNHAQKGSEFTCIGIVYHEMMKRLFGVETKCENTSLQFFHFGDYSVIIGEGAMFEQFIENCTIMDFDVNDFNLIEPGEPGYKCAWSN